MPLRPRKKAKAGYMISAVAEIYHLHPQTLRLYERVGLLWNHVVGLENCADPFDAHSRLRDRVGHRGQVLHRLEKLR